MLPVWPRPPNCSRVTITKINTRKIKFIVKMARNSISLIKGSILLNMPLCHGVNSVLLIKDSKQLRMKLNYATNGGEPMNGLDFQIFMIITRNGSLSVMKLGLKK